MLASDSFSGLSMGLMEPIQKWYPKDIYIYRPSSVQELLSELTKKSPNTETAMLSRQITFITGTHIYILIQGWFLYEYWAQAGLIWYLIVKNVLPLFFECVRIQGVGLWWRCAAGNFQVCWKFPDCTSLIHIGQAVADVILPGDVTSMGWYPCTQ